MARLYKENAALIRAENEQLEKKAGRKSLEAISEDIKAASGKRVRKPVPKSVPVPSTNAVPCQITEWGQWTPCSATCYDDANF